MGVTGAAIINNVNWKPATKPKTNERGTGNRALILKTTTFLIFVGYMLGFTIVRLAPYWHSQKPVTEEMVLAIGILLIGLVLFALIFFGFIGFLIGYFSEK